MLCLYILSSCVSCVSASFYSRHVSFFRFAIFFLCSVSLRKNKGEKLFFSSNYFWSGVAFCSFRFLFSGLRCRQITAALSSLCVRTVRPSRPVFFSCIRSILADRKTPPRPRGLNAGVAFFFYPLFILLLYPPPLTTLLTER